MLSITFVLIIYSLFFHQIIDIQLNTVMTQLILILDNLRSSANVGSILRTADSAGVERVICCGSTPYPRLQNDTRDPVVINRNMREISKTALGAESSVAVEYISDTAEAIRHVRDANMTIYALEQTENASNLLHETPILPAVLIVGNEVNGVRNSVIELCDKVLEIPQLGSKESLNVSVATGIAVYKLLEGRLKS